MPEITIIDSIMGSGKTTWAIKKMQKDKGPWLYITPYLDEVQRIVDACPQRAFVQPERATGQTKSEHLFQLVAEGRNIASTHELFKRVDQDIIEMIRLMGYSLIIDEVLEVIEALPIPPAETRTMLSKNALALGESKADGKVFQVLPGTEQDLEGFYVGPQKFPIKDLRQWAAMGRLVWLHDTVLMWLLPADALKAFKEVYNLTYLFKGSYAQAYYDLHGFEYEWLTVRKGGNAAEWVPAGDPALQTIPNLAGVVHVHKGPLNSVGEQHSALSFNWWRQKRQAREELMRKAMRNFFKYHVPSRPKAKDIMWTCFKDNLRGVAGEYGRHWVPHNQRATNAYRPKNALAFLCNRYMHPYIKGYFEALNLYLSEEQFALAELLQWIWRSAIRDGNPVNLFLPSSRMRSLLTAWMNGAGVDELG